MEHKWTQNYPSNSKYERLYNAHRLLAAGNLIILLDRLEPIEDLTEANKYLNKFRLEK